MKHDMSSEWRDCMNNNIPQFELNNVYYYSEEKILLLRIFEKIHMAKVWFINLNMERIIDINGITNKPVQDISIPISLLGGEKG